MAAALAGPSSNVMTPLGLHACTTPLWELSSQTADPCGTWHQVACYARVHQAMLHTAQLTADVRVITCAGVAALADGVDEGAHTVVVNVALAGAIDGRLLAVQVRVQPQFSQG